MKKISKLILGICAIIGMTTACSEDVNNWPVDPSYDRLFRTTHFNIVETKPTTITLGFNGVTDATKYVFEFSLGDSLLFNNIVKTEEVKADTLTAYSSGKFVVQNEYRKLFEELNGTSRYSVRMKAVNENTGAESDYYCLYFKTPAEQIFTGAVPGIKDATLNFESDKTATEVRIGQVVKGDTIWLETKSINATIQANGEIYFDGLNPGTTYIAQIMNGEFLRGTYSFTTLGSALGTAITVNPGDDVNALLSENVDSIVTLIFTGGQTYEIGGVTIPEGINRIYFSGSVVNGNKAKLMMKSAALSQKMNALYFQYVEIDDDNQNGFWMMISGSNYFENITFDGCTIRNIPNCLIYVGTSEAVINSITVNNCIVNRCSTSGWGVINIGKGDCKLGSITLTNSTICEIGDQLMDIRPAAEMITIDKCIFCNFEINMPKWIRINKQPSEIYVTNNIFAGNNGGGKLNSGYGDYSSWLDFSGCYLTADLVQNTKKFTNALQIELTTEELFVDPKNGDFHVKDGVTFAGKGKAGDPRWW